MDRNNKEDFIQIIQSNEGVLISQKAYQNFIRTNQRADDQELFLIIVIFRYENGYTPDIILKYLQIRDTFNLFQKNPTAWKGRVSGPIDDITDVTIIEAG